VPRHEKENEQIAAVLACVRFAVGGEEREVRAGASVPRAADPPHLVEAFTNSVVLDVFPSVRDDWLQGKDAYLRA
jgi:quercetin dioxygenase-like cupin family protein